MHHLTSSVPNFFLSLACALKFNLFLSRLTFFDITYALTQSILTIEQSVLLPSSTFLHRASLKNTTLFNYQIYSIVFNHKNNEDHVYWLVVERHKNFFDYSFALLKNHMSFLWQGFFRATLISNLHKNYHTKPPPSTSLHRQRYHITNVQVKNKAKYNCNMCPFLPILLSFYSYPWRGCSRT